MSLKPWGRRLIFAHSGTWFISNYLLYTKDQRRTRLGEMLGLLERFHNFLSLSSITDTSRYQCFKEHSTVETYSSRDTHHCPSMVTLLGAYHILLLSSHGRCVLPVSRSSLHFPSVGRPMAVNRWRPCLAFSANFPRLFHNIKKIFWAPTALGTLRLAFSGTPVTEDL